MKAQIAANKALVENESVQVSQLKRALIADNVMFESLIKKGQ